MSKQLRVVLAQINLMVGDIDGNATRVIDAARRAIDEYQADIVAFPELTLTGYPPEDLLLRGSLSKRVQRAIDQLLAANLDVHLVVGHPLRAGENLYNALSVIHRGKTLASYRKQYLPNYQVFDEDRYFEAGNSACIVDIHGIPVAMTICEDMWEPEPTRQAQEAGARLLININASPFHTGKLEQRQQLLRERASKHNLPILYANLVGGQDELVFDGGSMAVDAAGNCRVLGPSFEEALVPVTVSQRSDEAVVIEDGPIAAPMSIEASIYQALVLGLRDYVTKNGFRNVVLGLSGGIDSAVTLALAVDALGSEHVQAVMMPFEYTAQMSVDLAEAQARRLGVKYSVIPIAGPYASFMEALKEEFADLPVDVAEQNLQARCRGVILMAISNKKGALVLTTGNKSEMAVGYSTLYGDLAGGFDALKDVAKTMVYRIAAYRNALEDVGAGPVIPQQVIDRAPSAELAPGQVDQDNLPPYEELDAILAMYVEQDMSAHDIMERGFAEATVKRVLRLVDISEYKRRQSPIGVRLTQKGFGRDRRYPITSGWQLGD
jgi:NAD+ synthase (glutamine-hydrolysing)